MGKMRRALVIVGKENQRAEELLLAIISFLKNKKIEIEPCYYGGEIHSPKVEGSFDFAISLGGDGTVLFAARYCAPRGIPVFPINLGKFGFIANIEPEDWQEELENFLSGKLSLSERHLLSAFINKKDGENNFLALNDLVVSGSGIAKLINLDISFNGSSFGVYRADGVIVATPTGSTAYSAGSGGPILDPCVPAFLLTPIAPFSLSNRPIVLPADGKLEITILPAREKKIILSIDGQDLVSLNEGDKIVITQSERTVKMAACSPKHFYKALRSKLGWSGNRQ